MIPKRLRERQGMGAGTEVSFEEREDGVLVRTEGEGPPMLGRYRASGMAKRLLEDRADEPE